MSEQNPINYQMRGILSGFSALYGLFAVGCLAILALILLFVSDTCLKYGFATLAIIGFFSLGIYACILRHKDPQAFAIKQEIKIIVVHSYQVKEPKEKHPKIVVSKPIPPLLENPNKRKRLKQ